MRHQFDLVIIGGGIIGCAIAERMRGAVSRICLVEARADLGLGASAAAIGGITQLLIDADQGPLGPMAHRGVQRFTPWLEHISRAADSDIPVLGTGLLQAAFDPTQLDHLHETIPQMLSRRGVRSQPLSKEQLRAREPEIGPEVLGGLYTPSELAVEPALVLHALRRILTRDERVEVLKGRSVREVTSDGNGATVTLDNGDELIAEHAVIAAGHQSGPLLGLRSELLPPIKGQGLEFAAPDFALKHQCDTVLESGHVVFAVPRPQGRIAVGSTWEVGLDDDKPTDEGAQNLVLGLSTVLPRLAVQPISRHWAGVRSGSTDECPAIGFTDQTHRIVAATGHNGLGITLAPSTAHLVSALISRSPLDPGDIADLRISDPARLM
jgi:glycine oxidase